LRAENQAHHWGPPSAASTVRANEAHDCYRDGDFAEAAQWCEKGLGCYPEDFANRHFLGFARLFLNQLESCRNEWACLLAHKELETAQRALLLNNVAWVDLMIGGTELLQEADRFSQEAVKLQGSRAPYLGTRGSVLIELGEADKGLPLVQRAFEFNTDPRLKALNACYLVIAEVRRGNSNAATAHRDAAVKLDPNCQLLGKVERELAQFQLRSASLAATPERSPAAIEAFSQMSS